MVTINKNRNREKYTFANINLLGNCNADCYFCLGKDILQELAGKNQLNVHFSEWKNFEYFLEQCKKESVTKLYLTGQTADGLQYNYLDEIIDYLQNDGFTVGVRTNGYLAEAKINSIKKMKDEIGYSIHTLSPEKNKIIMGKRYLPNWKEIIPASGESVRISIVLNRYNIDEFDDLINFASSFSNVKYIQIRRISTDTRMDLLQKDIDMFEEFYQKFAQTHQQDGSYYLAQRYFLNGKEINFWRTVETSCNSLNYFTDGTCSNEYFIVEGYLKNHV
ncbi:MAG: radical SAM protein [Candidatus Methanofastidiosa archaeon]|nr:radical SAM protein [Candidatus Methanofastidiosa archaeon]